MHHTAAVDRAILWHWIEVDLEHICFYIPFLDGLYRKETHTAQFVSFQAHKVHHKVAWIRCLITRAK